jgi:competence ComEA-like helix-hairpin-helix protein
MLPAILAGALWPLRPAPAQHGSRPVILDINRAGVEELVQLPGIGPARAASIVRIRERNGPFRSVEELRALPRLPEKVFAQIRDRVTVTPVSNEPGRYPCQAEFLPPRRSRL